MTACVNIFRIALVFCGILLWQNQCLINCWYTDLYLHGRKTAAMNQSLTVTTIQTTLHWEDKALNLKMLEKKIIDIKEKTEIVDSPGNVFDRFQYAA